MSGLGWDADGLCDDHNRFGCEVCRMTPNPNPSPELLPCPHCTGTDIRIDRHQGAGTGFHRGEDVWSMCCYKCGATFPNRYRRELLVDAWNTRTLSPQTLPAPGEVERLRAIVVKHTKVGGYPDTMAIAQEAYQLALATVAAANDEGVFKLIERLNIWSLYSYHEMHQEQARALFSEAAVALARLATSRSQHEGAGR